MELKAAIEARTSIRVFSEEKVNMTDIREMVRLGGLAPSVNNFQPWRYIAVTNRKLLSEIADVVAEKIEELPASLSCFKTATSNLKESITVM